jgi:hypothetical protein
VTSISVGMIVYSVQSRRSEDRAAAALDIAGDAAGAAVEVETQRQGVQVPEHRQHHHARGARHHPREHDLAHFREHTLRKARGAVGQQQRDRDRRQARLDAECVDELLQHHRHRQPGNLGRQQAGIAMAMRPSTGAGKGRRRLSTCEVGRSLPGRATPVGVETVRSSWGYVASAATASQLLS